MSCAFKLTELWKSTLSQRQSSFSTMLSKFPLHISFTCSFVQRALIEFHQACLTLTNLALCGEMAKCPALSIAALLQRTPPHCLRHNLHLYWCSKFHDKGCGDTVDKRHTASKNVLQIIPFSQMCIILCPTFTAATDSRQTQLYQPFIPTILSLFI